MSVLWITGLSGAGKTTLAHRIAMRLRAKGIPVILLDGDVLREIFGIGIEQRHDRNSRLSLAFQYAHLCRILTQQGVTVVIATISLFQEIHAWNRANLPDYFEVYLKVPIDELRRRDPKGIYRRFDAGELINVAGLDLDIDEPELSNLVVEFQPNKSIEVVEEELLSIWEAEKINESKQF